MYVPGHSKKYQIEQMEGEKVVSRSRGFTVDSCVSAVLASQETPEFNGLPTGEKVSIQHVAGTLRYLKHQCKALAGSCS
jgi:hypothetical protein